MENLSPLESALLKSILEENKENYPFLLSHLPLVKVKDRECTGVGSYSNFEYPSPTKELQINDLLSSKKELMIHNLKNPLSYVLDVTNGKISYLEIVSNGDEEWWDGKAENFTLK